MEELKNDNGRNSLGQFVEGRQETAEEMLELGKTIKEIKKKRILNDKSNGERFS